MILKTDKQNFSYPWCVNTKYTMNPSKVSFPPRPASGDESIIQPSPAFKREVVKVSLAILLFILIYLLLIAAACGIAFFAAYGGLALIMTFPRFITIAIGGGLIGLGIMVFVFLVKFIFKSNKVDRSHLLEIKENDEPELFAFVKKITEETQAPFPKKIYLSADVNASVFYDSSFWSMILPVQKNLQIGLGLVNAVNISEFKAILAHEFGHFSQRSMKLGSYVYNVNHVIFSMLYDNENYGKALGTFASIGDIFAFFAQITATIVNGIMWVLKQVYGIVNKAYMSLSRQMEFHADSVAAYVSGSDHLITSLNRIQVADIAYNALISYYNQWFPQNLKAVNMFPQHTVVMMQFAKDHKLKVEHGLPQVDLDSFAYYNRSRLVIKNQWASHPSNEDRALHLNKINLKTEVIHQSPWVLFKDPEKTQKQLTEKLYETAKFAKTPIELDLSAFEQKYSKEVGKYYLDEAYNGFYDDRLITEFDLNELMNTTEGKNLSFEEIFNEQNSGIQHILNGAQNDLEILKAIDRKEAPFKTFDFDGIKYKRKDAGKLADQLKKELKELEQQQKEVDKQALLFFSKKATEAGDIEQWKQKWAVVFSSAKEAEKDIELSNKLIKTMNPIFEGEISLEYIKSIMRNAKKLEDRKIRPRLGEIMEKEEYRNLLDEPDRDKLDAYLKKEMVYFSTKTGFNNDNIAYLQDVITLYQFLAQARNFKIKKDVLDYQLKLIGKVDKSPGVAEV